MIEREFKYVLDDFSLEEKLRDLGEVKYIEQGYLAKGTRLRRSEIDGSVDYIFTYKHELETGDVMEIETHINREEYDRLWPHTKNRLLKTRITIKVPTDNDPFPPEEIWDIDFFKDNNHKTYFAMAECEVIKGELPSAILDELKDNILLHEADRREYSSKRISSISYARRKLKELEMPSRT